MKLDYHKFEYQPIASTIF